MSQIRILELMEAPQHVPAVAAWLHGEWERTHPHESLSDEDISKARKERESALRQHICLDPLPTTFLALEDQVPVGSCSLVHYRLHNTDVPSVWLTNLFVLPTFRGQGIASELLEVSEGFATIHGVKRLKIFTYDAKEFYLARQWNFIKNKSLQGVPVDILEKVLA